MFLRRLSDKRNWDWTADIPSWVPAGDIPAAPFADFNSSHDSKISVWYVDSNESNLQRIIAGIAATRQTADKFDYVLFPENVLSEAGLEAHNAPGKSKDNDANANWHRDVVDVSATKLLELVKLVSREGRVHRSSEKEIIKLIQKFVNDGLIEKQALSKDLIKHL